MGLKWWWALALAGACCFPGVAHSLVVNPRQQSTNPAAADSPDKLSPTAPKTPPPKTEPDQSGAKKPRHKSTKATRKSSSSRKAPVKKRRKRPVSPRVRRIRQAFVASATLRPMAQQLIANRTPAAYTGVVAYAHAHAKEDAGALAWLVVGYAHFLDHECPKAIEPLNRAKPLSGDLGDYVTYYL